MTDIAHPTPELYGHQLGQLLPHGAAWPSEPGSTLEALLNGLGRGLADAHGRTLDLREEADPFRSVELLPDWERVAGLPDPCTGQAETVAERQARLVARLAGRGGQSRAFFIATAGALGYAITLEEHRPFHCLSACEDGLDPDPWRFVWIIRAPEETIRVLTSEGGCSEPLRSWGNQALECAIRRAAPAHTTPYFAYGD